MCANPACRNIVDYSSIEVIGHGFVCSIVCEDAVLNRSPECDVPEYDDLF